MKVIVILPTCNERGNIAPLTREVLASPVAADVLIVDDDSPDGTGEIADGLAAENDRVHVVHRAHKRGLGSATIDGLRLAIDRGCDFAVVMDADYSHHPRYLGDLVRGMTRFDVTIGSRYVRGGGIVGWPPSRRVLSFLANAVARLCLGLRVHDCTGSIRCYRLAMMRAGVVDRVRAEGYAYLEEILHHCRSAGMRLGEVPIVFEPRRAGVSKLSWRELVGGLRRVITLGLARLLGREDLSG